MHPAVREKPRDSPPWAFFCAGCYNSDRPKQPYGVLKMRMQPFVALTVVVMPLALLCNSRTHAADNAGVKAWFMGDAVIPLTGLGILRIERVRKELELSPEQCKSIHEIEEYVRERSNESPSLPLQTAGLTRDEFLSRARDFQRHADEIASDVKRRLGTILTAQQNERLRGLHIQLLGQRTLFDPEVAASEMGITDEQRQRYRKLEQPVARARVESRSKMSADERKAQAKRLREQRRVEEDEIFKQVLTEEQWTKFEKMRGKLFDFSDDDRKLASGVGPKAVTNSSADGGGNPAGSPSKGDSQPDANRERK
jgi:hypothetical protein